MQSQVQPMLFLRFKCHQWLGGDGVTTSTEIVPVMCLQGPSFVEVSGSVGSLMGIMGYSLSSNWASGRKCYSHHNEYQSEFPSGCMVRAFS